MGTGLYDAVFAALGKLYGRDARGADHQPDLVRRLCQHGVLAAQRISRRDLRLARDLPDLRRAPSGGVAAVADGGDAGAIEPAGRNRSPIQRAAASLPAGDVRTAGSSRLSAAGARADDFGRHRFGDGGVSADVSASEGRRLRHRGRARYAVRAGAGRCPIRRAAVRDALSSALDHGGVVRPDGRRARPAADVADACRGDRHLCRRLRRHVDRARHRPARTVRPGSFRDAHGTAGVSEPDRRRRSRLRPARC